MNRLHCCNRCYHRLSNWLKEGLASDRDDVACVACAMRALPVSQRPNLDNVNLIYGQSRRLFEICIAGERRMNMPADRRELRAERDEEDAPE